MQAGARLAEVGDVVRLKIDFLIGIAEPLGNEDNVGTRRPDHDDGTCLRYHVFIEVHRT